MTGEIGEKEMGKVVPVTFPPSYLRSFKDKGLRVRLAAQSLDQKQRRYKNDMMDIAEILKRRGCHSVNSLKSFKKFL